MINTEFQPEFIEAVNKNDVSYLRSFIASTIRVDPAFNKSKCDECMSYIQAHGLNITEDFKLNSSEKPTPENVDEWNKDLFHDKVEYLRLNFAYNERVSELKKIGKVVYADKIIKEITPSFREAPKGCRSKMKKSSPLMLVGAIAAIVAIVTAIVLLCRK